MEERLKTFLSGYLGQGTQQNDTVTQEAIELLALSARLAHIEQEIIDYGTENPESPFWELLNLIPVGINEGEDDDEEEV